MADTYYAKKSKTPQEFIWDLCRFLVNDLAGETGPGWTLIDTYGQAAAVDHEVPGDGTDVDSLAADNPWRTGAANLSIGDYFVVQNSAGGQKFMVGFELQANDQIRVILDFKSGFDTANNDNDMTAAGNWTSTVSSTILFDPNNGANPANFSIVADEDRALLFCEDGVVSRQNFLYVGNYEAIMTEDEYHSCIYITPLETGHVQGVGFYDDPSFEKLSMSDDTTLINLACLNYYYDATALTSNAATILQESSTSKWAFLPVFLASDVAGHLGMFGTLKKVYIGHENMLGAGQSTFDTQNWLAFSDNATYEKTVIPWDGSTVY